MSKRKSVALAHKILELIEGDIYFKELELIAEEFSGNKKSDQLKFMNRLYSLISSLPVDLWDNETERNKSLSEILKYIELENMKDVGINKLKHYGGLQLNNSGHFR